jgi:hypothetical protein
MIGGNVMWVHEYIYCISGVKQSIMFFSYLDTDPWELGKIPFIFITSDHVPVPVFSYSSTNEQVSLVRDAPDIWLNIQHGRIMVPVPVQAIQPIVDEHILLLLTGTGTGS